MLHDMTWVEFMAGVLGGVVLLAVVTFISNIFTRVERKRHNVRRIF